MWTRGNILHLRRQVREVDELGEKPVRAAGLRRLISGAGWLLYLGGALPFGSTFGAEPCSAGEFRPAVYAVSGWWAWRWGSVGLAEGLSNHYCVGDSIAEPLLLA